MKISIRLVPVMFALLTTAACSSPDEGSETQGGSAVSDAAETCTNVWTPSGTERKAIVEGIHRYFDPNVKQANEYVISSFLTDGKHAFVQGEIIGTIGSDGKRTSIDWSKSAFAKDVSEGLFDGGRFEALAVKTGDTWAVVTDKSGASAASVGSTDAWWYGLWDDAKVPQALFPVTQPACEIRAATQDQRAVVAALHAQFDKALGGQAHDYDVAWLRTDGIYAFIKGEVKGNVDWTKTALAEDVKEGLFDGAHVEALVKRDGKGWKVVEYTQEGERRVAASIGSTDVWWDGLWDEAAAAEKISREIFP